MAALRGEDQLWVSDSAFTRMVCSAPSWIVLAQWTSAPASFLLSVRMGGGAEGRHSRCNCDPPCCNIAERGGVSTVARTPRLSSPRVIMAEQATEWFGMRVTPSQKEKIERLADRRGTTQKAAVLEAVEHELAEDGAEEPQPGSVLELTEDLCGSVEGPPDLSTNPKHMEGYGKD